MLVIVGATLSSMFLKGNDILAKATCSLEFGIGLFTLLYEVFPIGSDGNWAQDTDVGEESHALGLSSAEEIDLVPWERYV